MRQYPIILISLVLLLSCGTHDTSKVLSDTTNKQQNEIKTIKTERQILIEELKRLQAVLATNDKEKIATIFSLPAPNEAIGIYIDDSSFNAQLNKNNNLVTRPMFINFYQDISENLQINQINQLFKKISIDNLLVNNNLEHEAIMKTEPCYYFYSIKVENNLVTLTVGTNSNKNFKSKNISEDEIPENDSSICEHVLWWIFRFDGNRLQFKEISGAG